MSDLVDVSLNLPKGYREFLEHVAATAVVPIDQVVAVIFALHLCSYKIPVAPAEENE